MEILSRYRELLVSALGSLVEGIPSPILTMCHYHLGLIEFDGTQTRTAAGKMLRPALCLAICEALGGNIRQCLPAALSLEIIHRASLVFDDIQDGSPQRNHRPTIWRLWGRDQAINGGLALTCYARLALHGMANDRVSQRGFLEVHRLIEETILDLCHGQYLDLHYQTESPSVEQYLEMARLKTGVLLGTSCEIGALMAGASNKQGAARRFGESLGIGYQLRDDYLGVWGDPLKIGKPADDIKDRQGNLPLLMNLKVEAAVDKGPDAIDWLVEEWTRQTHDHLSDIGLPNRWREPFAALVEVLASRQA